MASETSDRIACCAQCGKRDVLPWLCESCRDRYLPAVFCSMACVWAHGPAVHADPRNYQIAQRAWGSGA